MICSVWFLDIRISTYFPYIFGDHLLSISLKFLATFYGRNVSTHMNIMS